MPYRFTYMYIYLSIYIYVYLQTKEKAQKITAKFARCFKTVIEPLVHEH